MSNDYKKISLPEYTKFREEMEVKQALYLMQVLVGDLLIKQGTGTISIPSAGYDNDFDNSNNPYSSECQTLDYDMFRIIGVTYCTDTIEKAFDRLLELLSDMGYAVDNDSLDDEDLGDGIHYVELGYRQKEELDD